MQKTLVAAILVAGTAVGAHAANVTVRGTVTLKGLKSQADAVVSLEAPGLTVVPPTEPVRIDQKGFRFLPHITVVVPGTTVRFLNNDPEPHNVYSPEGRYNLGTWPTGDTKDHTFTQPGVYSQLCNVHPDMLAFIVVVPTSYFALTDVAGRFEIRGVPPGKYKAVVFHEKKDGSEQDVTIGPGPTQTLDLLVER